MKWKSSLNIFKGVESFLILIILFGCFDPQLQMISVSKIGWPILSVTGTIYYRLLQALACFQVRNRRIASEIWSCYRCKIVITFIPLVSEISCSSRRQPNCRSLQSHSATYPCKNDLLCIKLVLIFTRISVRRSSICAPILLFEFRTYCKLDLRIELQTP